MEFVADDGEQRIDGVAGTVSEMIAAHAVLGFEMADHLLDGGSPFKLAFDLRHDAALLRFPTLIGTMKALRLPARLLLQRLSN